MNEEREHNIKRNAASICVEYANWCQSVLARRPANWPLTLSARDYDIELTPAACTLS